MNALTGTVRLVRHALRRDRVLLPVWLVALTALVMGAMSSVIALYQTEAERQVVARFTASNQISRVFDGPAAGTDPGAMASVETFVFAAVLVALMSVQAVVRHTRQEEETGRAELIGAGVVGHHAPLAAALVVAIGANLVLAAAVTGGLMAIDLAVAPSILSGLAYAGVGITFAGIGAITAQLAAQSRAANGLAGAVIGVAFLLRAVGDAAGTVTESGVEVISAWPSWLSPIGWGQQVRAFHTDRWEVLALFLVASVLSIGVAVVLAARRDVGGAVLSVRPGPPRAPRTLRGPLGLAWRQHRGALLGWAVGIGVVGTAFGVVGEGAEELMAAVEQLEEMLVGLGEGGDLVDAYLAFAIRILGIVAAGFTVQALLRARGEEQAGRAEPVLAAAVGRVRWLGAHVVVALAGSIALVLLLGIAAGLGFAVATGDLGQVGRPLTAALVQLPAVLALGSVVVLAVAVVPRWAAAIGWGALAAGLVISQFGDLLELPQAVMNLSQFTHPPLVPVDAVAALPLIALLSFAAVVGAGGLAWFRRRDLVTT